MAGRLIKQQDEIILNKLREKGVQFNSEDELFEGRFPKVTNIKKNGWAYWFYNDGTKDGVFLIAFGNFEVIADENNSIKVEFKTKEIYSGEVDKL